MTEYITSDDFKVHYEGKGTAAKYTASSQDSIYLNVINLEYQQFTEIIKNIKPNNPNMKAVFMEGEKGTLIAECQFKKAYKNSGTEPYIKLGFHYDTDTLEVLDSMLGKEYDFCLMEGEAVKKSEIKGEHGQFARQLAISPVLYQRSTWELLGTEATYLDWVRDQPCVVTSKRQERCEAAHFRNLTLGGGIGLKPEYMAAPMLSKIHAKQHEKGLVHVWEKAGRPTPSKARYPIEDKLDQANQWMMSCVFELLKSWSIVRIKEHFHIPSLSMLSPEMLEELIPDYNTIIKSGKYPWEFY